MRKDRNTNAKLKNGLFALMLVSFSVIGFRSIAKAQTNPVTPVQAMSAATDTVKMIAGVPLKAEDVSPLLAGEQIPVLQLRSSSGDMFDLNKSVSEIPTILVFYRGGWCPYCSKQLSGLQEIEEDLMEMGYQVIAVSTDSPENLNKSIDKGKLSYTLLSDADLHAARRFGIAFKGPKNYDRFLPETSGGKNIDKLLPVPSVFILNKKGTILFEYINPNITHRLSAPLLKAAAAALRNDVTGKSIDFIENSLLTALKKAKTERKYIFVDAYTNWCGPCKQLKNTTFKDIQTADFFNKNFVNLSVDMEKGEGKNLADRWEVQEYPTLLMLDNNGNILLRSTGYLDAEQLIALGKKALQKK